MKRSFHLGLTLLCLLALVVVPVLSGKLLHAAEHGCRQSMSDSMPMPPTQTAPCCAVHPPDQIAPATVDTGLVLLPPTALALEPPFAAARTCAAQRPTLPSVSPPHAFSLPLRI